MSTSVMIVETPRLWVRQFERSDWDALAEMMGDPLVMRFSQSGPKSYEGTGAWLEWCLREYQRLGYGRWAVVHKEDHKLCGLCGLGRLMVDGVDELDMGYRLGRGYWNRGLATEAAGAAKAWAFANLPHARVVAAIDPLNKASIRVAEKLGMRYEKDSPCLRPPYEHRIYVAEKPVGGGK